MGLHRILVEPEALPQATNRPEEASEWWNTADRLELPIEEEERDGNGIPR